MKQTAISLTKELRSAIIGFWRCGASMEEMVAASRLSKTRISQVIREYENKIR